MVTPAHFSRSIILAAWCCLAAGGCATVNVPNMGQEGYKVESDESRMFKRADEMIDVLDHTDHIYPNVELEQYLTGLANKLLPDNVRDQVNISVRVIDDPSLNAFALANGRVYVHVGILAAADNEAQVASLLAHEMTHVLNRHILKQFRSLQNKTAFLTVASLATSGLTDILVQLTTISTIYGYSKSLEYEADTVGFDMLVEHNYDVREAATLFEHLARFIKDEEIKEPYFFSSHPGTKSREENFRKLIKERNIVPTKDMIVDTPQFESFWKPVVLDTTKYCLSSGLFKTSERNLDRFLAVYPKDPDGQYLQGELYRQRQDPPPKTKKRDKKEDYPKAVEAYDKALALQPRYCEAMAGKARVLQKEEQAAQAKEVFRQYLECNPEAPDRAYIEFYISSN